MGRGIKEFDGVQMKMLEEEIEKLFLLEIEQHEKKTEIRKLMEREPDGEPAPDKFEAAFLALRYRIAELEVENEKIDFRLAHLKNKLEDREGRG